MKKKFFILLSALSLVFLLSLLGGPSGFFAPITIIRSIRLPRTILGLLVGGMLGVSGASLQGVFNNRLVDPYFLGSATGGVFFLAFFSFFFPISIFLRPLVGFAGSFITMLVVYLLASKFRETELHLVLSGIAVNFLLSGGIMLIMILSKRPLSEIIYSIMGNLGFIFTRESIFVGIVFLFIALGAGTLLFLKHRELDIASFEKETVKTLGIDFRKLLTQIFFLTSIITGISVSFAGSISFVGLIVPQISRVLFGERHINVLPASFLLGGLVLLLSDIPARMLFPFELPLSVVTSFIGVPFFIYIMRKGYEISGT